MRKRLSVMLTVILLLNMVLGMTALAAEETSFKVAVTPANGEKGVPVGTKSIKLSFDRDVREGDGSIQVFSNGNLVVERKIISQGYVIRSMEVNLPPSDLEYNTTYHIVGNAGAFVDAAKENVKSEAFDLSFTTISAPNSKAPIIINDQLTPAKGTTISGTSQGINLAFDKPVWAGGGSVSLVRASTNESVKLTPKAAGDTKESFTVDRLVSGERYYILIDKNAYKDSDDQYFAGINNAQEWYFNVQGSAVGWNGSNATVPKNGASEVDIKTKGQLNFTRPVYPNTGMITIDSKNGKTNIDVTSSNVKGGGTTSIAIDWPELSYNTTYTVNVPQGAFKDADGNDTPSASWSFTTATAASSTLSISNFSPSDRSTNVSVSSIMTATFNRNITLLDASKVTLKMQGSNTSVAVKVTASSNRLSVTPNENLREGTTYYIDIASGAVADAVTGAVFSGISGSSSWTFQTGTKDKTTPVLQSATMYTNSIIRLSYNKALDSSINLLTTSFTVSVNGETRRISNAYISGESVYVTLETGVAVGQNVRVGYTSNGVRPIQDLSGNVAASFSSKDVTNGIDSVLPKPKEGVVSGSTLTLYFSDTLKSVSTYAYEQFSVTVDGYSRGIDRIYQSGSSVTLYLTSSVSNGDNVKVSYYPGSYPLQDYRGQDIPSFEDYYVRNTYDTKPPEFTGAEGSGNKIILSYNEALKTTNIPMKSQFSVLVNNSPVYVTNVEIMSNQVILTLASSFTQGQNVTVSYVSGVGGIADLNGNLAGYINLQPVQYNVVVEGIRSAVVRGDTITISYNKYLRAVNSFPVNQFYVSADKIGVNIQSVTVSGDTVTIKLGSSVLASQTVEISYTSGLSVLYDSTGNVMKSYSAMSVTNLTSSGSTTTPGTNGQPSYLVPMPLGDFGLNGYAMGTNVAQSSTDRSRYGQSIKKYTIDSAKLKESLAFTTGAQRMLAFEVPATERAAAVVIPVSPLMDLYTAGKKGSIAIKYGEVLYTLPLEKLPYSDISRAVGTGSYDGVNMLIRLEPVPTINLPSPAPKPGITISSYGDPIEIYVAASNSTGSIESEVAHQGQLYIRSSKQVDINSASLLKYDLAARTAAYTPSIAQMFGSNIVFTGKIKENTIVGAAIGYSYFDDTSKHWAKNDIAELANKMIVEPREGSYKFEPDKNITRAEFAMFIAKGLGLTGDQSSARRFPDVTAGSETGAYIGAAAKAGIINGNSDGTFKPNSNITREQMALMMVRAMEYAGYDITNSGTQTLVKFKDAAKIQNKQTVAKAVQEGIIQGMTQTTFQPQGNATRAQAAVMLKRVLDKLNS
ncbi:Ig-like domain-containing protein [Paenibacillus sp. GM2]|uniref:Ig-like domain-containing protein n=1 Tax=Paenibacillus sp. GM2 TaxID=1622070 RepID=UPI00083836B5|nr:Ig-like domain-containing protein [Paenibacillus sp. GM2]